LFFVGIDTEIQREGVV